MKLNKGADISQPNADGRTALHVACCEGNLTVVRHLLKMGANVHVKDRFNRTPLTDAVEFDQHEVCTILVFFSSFVFSVNYSTKVKLILCTNIIVKIAHIFLFVD